MKTRAEYEKLVEVLRRHSPGAFLERDYLATPSDPTELRVATVNCDVPESDAAVWAGDMAVLAVRSRGYLTMSVSGERAYLQVMISRRLDEQDKAAKLASVPTGPL